MPTDKYNPHSSSRKFLIATDGDHYRKPQPIRTELLRPVPKDHLENSSTSKAQETLRKREQKDSKNQKIWEFAVRLYLLVM